MGANDKLSKALYPDFVAAKAKNDSTGIKSDSADVASKTPKADTSTVKNPDTLGSNVTATAAPTNTAVLTKLDSFYP